MFEFPAQNNCSACYFTFYCTSIKKKKYFTIFFYFICKIRNDFKNAEKEQNN